MFEVLKCICIFESTDRFIYKHVHIDLVFKRHTNADLKIYQYICLHKKIMCQRYTHRDVKDICLQTYRNSRIC